MVDEIGARGPEWTEGMLHKDLIEIDADNTLLMVVDLQEDFLTKVFGLKTSGGALDWESIRQIVNAINCLISEYMDALSPKGEETAAVITTGDRHRYSEAVLQTQKGLLNQLNKIEDLPKAEQESAIAQLDAEWLRLCETEPVDPNFRYPAHCLEGSEGEKLRGGILPKSAIHNHIHLWKVAYSEGDDLGKGNKESNQADYQAMMKHWVTTKKTFFLSGVATEICVWANARSLLEAGAEEIVIVVDLTSPLDKEDSIARYQALQKEFGEKVKLVKFDQVQFKKMGMSESVQKLSYTDIQQPHPKASQEYRDAIISGKSFTNPLMLKPAGEGRPPWAEPDYRE